MYPRSVLLAVLLGAACVAPRQESPPPEGSEVAGPPPLDAARTAGTLSWEELSVRMVGRETSAGLRIDVTTLSDDALVVAAPDIRDYLGDLKARIPEGSFGGTPAHELTPFLVGYTGFEKQVGFDPTLLLIDSEGSTYYPRTIVPVSRGFDRRVVDLYETVYALYLFDPGLDLAGTLEFRYGDLSSGDTWRGIVQGIQRAQARIDSQR